MSGGKRVRRRKVEVVLPEVILRRVRATAALLGTSNEEVAIAGCRLFCTYVLAEVEPRLRPQGAVGKGSAKCQVEKLVSVLARKFGRRGSS